MTQRLLFVWPKGNIWPHGSQLHDGDSSFIFTQVKRKQQRDYSCRIPLEKTGAWHSSGNDPDSRMRSALPLNADPTYQQARQITKADFVEVLIGFPDRWSRTTFDQVCRMAKTE